MSQNTEEKTEQPTQKKITDARRDGKIAKSNELSSFFSLVTLLLYFAIAKTYLINLFFRIYIDLINVFAEENLTLINIIQLLKYVVNLLLIISMPPVIIITVISVCSKIIQMKGITFAKQAIKFDLKSLNLVNNFKQLFSKKKLFKLLKNIVEVITITVISIILYQQNIPSFLLIQTSNLKNATYIFSVFLLKTVLSILVIHLVFSITDYIIEIKSLNKELMMSLKELKDENKETNGNPEIKQRQKELYRELLDEDELENLMNGNTLVMANPTHFAVLLYYSPKHTNLPIILVKSSGYPAQIIFRVAKRLNVPIVRDKWLTRRLYKLGNTGQAIPISMQKEISYIFAKNLYRLPKIAQELKI